MNEGRIDCSCGVNFDYITPHNTINCYNCGKIHIVGKEAKND